MEMQQPATGEPAWAVVLRDALLGTGRRLALSEYFKKLLFLC